MRRCARLGSALVFVFGVVLAPMAHRLHHAASAHGHEHPGSPDWAVGTTNELIDPDELLDEELAAAPELTFGDLLAGSGPEAPNAGGDDHQHGELPGRPHGQGSLAHDDLAMGAVSVVTCILGWDRIADAVAGSPHSHVPAPLAGLPEARGPPRAA